MEIKRILLVKRECDDFNNLTANLENYDTANCFEVAIDYLNENT